MYVVAYGVYSRYAWDNLQVCAIVGSTLKTMTEDVSRSAAAGSSPKQLPNNEVYDLVNASD